MEIIKITKGTSSNTIAMEKLEKENVNEGTVVWVDEQTEGRGQQNNTWQSETGKNLTFSIILSPKFLKPDKQFYLSKAIALGVSDYVGLFASDVSIKWFNDILVQGKKVAGILIENTWQGNNINNSVVGIGLNLNQETFPNELPNAVSLIMSTGVPFNIEESLHMLHSLIMSRYAQLKDNEFTAIDIDYHKVLFGLNEKKKFFANGQSFEAIIVEVEANGFLRLKHDDGKIASYGMHDIKML